MDNAITECVGTDPAPLERDGKASSVKDEGAAVSAAAQRSALYALALGTFAVGTEGFMIAAILPSIAHSLSISVQVAGQLVTIFALVYAVSSPFLTALTASLSRRHLLMLALAAFMVANLVAALAHSFWALAAARVLLALTAGLYVPNANAVAGAIVPAAWRGRALAIVNGGITVAVAIGVPLGAVVGVHVGWRYTFVAVAVLSAIALTVLGAILPRNIAGSPPASIQTRLAVATMPGAFEALGTTTLWATGAYAVYTYVSPFLASATGLGADRAGLVLTLFGVAALGGVALGGIANDRVGARRVQSFSLPVMATTFAALSVSAWLFAPHALPVIVPLVACWGLSAWAFYPPQQNRLIDVAGAQNTPVILSLNASFMYLGFSLGAAIGSLTITLLSITWIGAVGAACLLGAMALSRLAWARSRSLS
ncbi:MFS transporter [Paraburkholderia ginsengiterrae]|uniref:MFS transporter n=1 Tax=Paraburkholderia ginsengiterrae TaxID=1462993 RepID=UPI0009ED4AAE|nr:MFS transporter [Paraburkholderia ginsengiterrae]